MKWVSLIVCVVGVFGASALAQGPAFVPQVSEMPRAISPQTQAPSDAFVTQVPSDARPRQAPVAGAAPPPPTARNFIEPALHAGVERPLIVEQNQAVVPFDSEERPSLPTIGQGAGVSLVSGAQTLPSVGAGAVVL